MSSQTPTELWVLLYIHNWDPVDQVTKVQPVYPEVSGIYHTWDEAKADRLKKESPEKYWIRRGTLQPQQM